MKQVSCTYIFCFVDIPDRSRAAEPAHQASLENEGALADSHDLDGETVQPLTRKPCDAFFASWLICKAWHNPALAAWRMQNASSFAW